MHVSCVADYCVSVMDRDREKSEMKRKGKGKDQRQLMGRGDEARGYDKGLT